MKKPTIAVLLAGQVLAAAQPALAADFTSAQEQRAGAFAGFRLRMPFDGPQRRQVRAGFALAPTLGTRGMNGESRLRIGEGLEFGVRGRKPLQLSIAGRDVRRLGAQDANRRGGIPTGAWIAGGIVLVAIAGVTFVAIVLDNVNDADD